MHHWEVKLRVYALKYSYHHEIPRLMEGNSVEEMKLLAKYIHCVT